MNKIKNIIRLVVLSVMLGSFASCDSYLDMKDDDMMTFDKIWMKRNTTLQYLSNVWSFMPKAWLVQDQNAWTGASDEAILAFDRDYRKINFGTWGPGSVPYSGQMWNKFYKGIREASIFIQNVESCSATDVTPDEIQRWKEEARFVRAFQYFYLFRAYGPFIITGDDPVDITQFDLNKGRSSLDDCVNYIVSEFEQCAKVLPDFFDENQDTDYGRPTKGAALAMIGRVRLYAARPLFNGNQMYKNVKNYDGSELFPATYDANKWKLAADANKAFLNFCEQGDIYELHKNKDNNPYLSYQELFITDWNKELIFARYNSRFDLQVLLTPAVVGGLAYGGCGPTQKQVDAYAMSNGRYPITGYASGGTPIIDQTSGYVENGFSSFVHPIDNIDGEALDTYNMYIGREPRFYVSVLWSSALWPYKASKKYPVYAYNGNSGPGPRHDYTKSGYMTRKFVNPGVNSEGGTWGNMTFPLIRLAEVYLNYAEALNEVDPSNTDVLKYMNKVRARAGVPNIETVYPEAVGDKVKMRELIQKERQVEFFFEGFRYFDARGWLTAEKEFDGAVYGMNVMGANAAGNINQTPAEFWQRTVIEDRIFKPAFYLYPIAESTISKNPYLVQNPYWR